MKLAYPITIICTHYGGIYESGQWAAFRCYRWEVPEAATGDDISCDEFWRSEEAEQVGRGATPEEALLDLLRRRVTLLSVEGE